MLAFIRALFACLLVICALGAADTVKSQEVDPFALLFATDDPDIDTDEDPSAGLDDLNIITLRLRDLTLEEGFTAFDTAGGMCLPFEPLSQALEFPIEVSEDGIASGWFISEGRTLEIDFWEGEARLADTPIDLPDEPFSDTDDGWCATLDALTAIYPMAFEYDARNLRVIVTPDEVLPIEERLERAAFREDALKRVVRGHETFEMADNPYRWMSWPVADVGVDVRTGSGGKVSVNFDIEAAGDVLGTTGRVRTVGGSKAGILDNLRITLGRSNPDPVELGPLAARRFELGDVSTPSLPLVSKSINGAGVVITNRSSYKADLFDTTVIRGPLPNGWEAELYAGPELLAFVTEPDDNGDYVFEEVPLRSGYNRFTVKLYGPFGETDTREIKHFVGAELEPENETSYFVGLINSQKPVVDTFGLASGGEFDADEPDEDADADLLTLGEEGEESFGLSSLFDVTLANPRDGPDRTAPDSYMLMGSASHGLTDKVTVRFDAAVGLQDSNSDKSMASVSVASSLAGGFAVGRVASDGKGVPAIEAAYQRRIFGNSNVSLRAVTFNDLENEITGRGDSRLTQLAQIRGNSTLTVRGRAIPVQAGLNYRRMADGVSQLEANARLSGRIKGFRVTNAMQYSVTNSDLEAVDSLGGSLLFSRNHGPYRILGGASYAFDDGFSVQNLGVSAQRDLGKRGVGSLSVTHNVEQGNTSLGATWSKSFKRATLSTNATVSDDSNWSMGVRLGFSLAKPDEALLPTIAPTQNLSRAATVQGHVFIDDNLNGVYDEGEETVKDAQLAVNGSAKKPLTDEHGVVLLDKISTESIQNISIHLSSIDDPFLVPAEAGRAYIPRPGQRLVVPVALQPTGDAEGYLTVVKGEHSMGAGGVPVHAIDKNGKVVAESMTDFDGYFYLDKLPLRDLILRVPEAAMEGTDIVSEDVPIRLTADEPSVFDAEVTVFVN